MFVVNEWAFVAVDPASNPVEVSLLFIIIILHKNIPGTDIKIR